MNQFLTRFERFGRYCLLSWDVLRRSLVSPIVSFQTHYPKILSQLYRMGVQSFAVVALISIFLGMILSLQTAYQLQQFGATAYVGSLVTVSVVRELGPLLTAILIAGRVGAGITAELGSMVVHDEITALNTMAINPREFLLVPRQVALVIGLPILTLIANALAIGGGMILSWSYLGIPMSQFYRIGQTSIVLADLATGFTKSVVFAILIATISCYKGFSVRGGASEVGKATTETVVLSIVYIIFADLIFTFLFYFM